MYHHIVDPGQPLQAGGQQGRHQPGQAQRRGLLLGGGGAGGAEHEPGGAGALPAWILPGCGVTLPPGAGPASQEQAGEGWQYLTTGQAPAGGEAGHGTGGQSHSQTVTQS